MALSQQELWSLKDELELIKEYHHYQLKNDASRLQWMT
jgi:hypothetical protein